MRMTRNFLKELPVYLALGVVTAVVTYVIRQNRALTEQTWMLTRRAVDPRPGLFVPELAATTLEGVPITLGQAGHRQVLLFFNHTCPYCRASLAAWNAIAAALEAHGDISVYGIAFDSSVTASAYAAEHALHFPIVATPGPRVAGLYRVSRVPLVLVVTEEGRMGYVRMGAIGSQLAIDSVLRAATSSHGVISASSGKLGPASDPGDPLR